MWLVHQCVRPSTQRTYRSGWNRWVAYATQFAFCPWFSSIPDSWSSQTRAYDFPTAVTLNFMCHSFINENKSAGSICNNLSAVRYHLECRNINCAHLSSPAVMHARAALLILCRQRVAVREVGSLPASLELIESFAKTHSQHTFRNRGIYIAMRLAHLLLLRISEYTITDANHFLRSDDVSFLVDGRRVPAYLVTSSLSSSQIEGVLIDLRSAKNDGEGRGHRFFFRYEHSPGAPVSNICSLLFEWALGGQLQPGQAFFTHRSIWTLTAKDISSALKKVAAAAGFDPRRFRPHSLRYGGASALAAANVPTYLIQQLGRWRSLAFLQYIQLSESLLSSAQRVLSDVSVFTSRDVRHLHAGVLT